MASPHFHFPHPKPPKKGDRDLFHDYGSLLGFNNIFEKNGDQAKLFQLSKNQEDILCAKGSILPLGPPNPGHATPEPCAGLLMRSYREKSIFYKRIRHSQRRTYLSDSFKGPAKGSRLERSLRYISYVIEKYRDTPFTPLGNLEYTGGCMSGLDTDLGQLLCHPSGPDLSIPAITKLEPSNKDVTPIWTGENDGSRIQQIESATVGNSHYNAIRTENGSCRVYRIQENQEGSLGSKLVSMIPNDPQIKSISLSPFIDVECATTDDLGQVSLWNERQELASLKIEPRFPSHESWSNAHFGSHPRQLVVSDRTGSSLWDLRAKPRSEDLFVLPNPLLRTNDLVWSCQNHPGRPFYHILATEEVFMALDERFTTVPVLLWRHGLVRPPQYMSVLSNVLGESSDDVVLLGSQIDPEVQCFQLGMSNKSLPPVFSSTPWRMAGPLDMLNLYTNSHPKLLPTDDAVDRIKAPLIGVATTRLKNKGMRIFQMTSYGDLYHQAYVPGSPDLEKTWASGPGSVSLQIPQSSLDHIKKWMSELSDICLSKPPEDPLFECELPEKKLERPRKANTHCTNVARDLLKIIPKEDPIRKCEDCDKYFYDPEVPPRSSVMSAPVCSSCIDISVHQASSSAEEGMVCANDSDDEAEFEYAQECLKKLSLRFVQKVSGLSDIFYYNWGPLDQGDSEVKDPSATFDTSKLVSSKNAGDSNTTFGDNFDCATLSTSLQMLERTPKSQKTPKPQRTPSISHTSNKRHVSFSIPQSNLDGNNESDDNTQQGRAMWTPTRAPTNTPTMTPTRTPTGTPTGEHSFSQLSSFTSPRSSIKSKKRKRESLLGFF